jgi:hypothetical protein
VVAVAVVGEPPGEPHLARHVLQLEGLQLGHRLLVRRRLGALHLRPELRRRPGALHLRPEVRHLYRRRRARRQEDPAVVEAVVAE